MTETSLSKNILWTVLSRIGAQAVAVLSTILLARHLGSAGFGEYAFISTLLLIANSLTTFGTDMLLIREIAARDDLSRLPAALILQLSLSVLSILFVWLFGSQLPNQSAETLTALRVYVFALIPLSFFTVFTTALRGKQKMEAYNLLNLIMAFLQLSVVFVIRNNIILLFSTLLLMQIIVALIAGLVCTLNIHDFWRGWKFASLNLGEFIRDTMPIAVLVVLGMIYQRINIALLSTLSNATQTGIYSAASRAVEASKIVHFAVFTAMYPAMAKSNSESALTIVPMFSRNKLGNDGRVVVLLLSGTIFISLALFTLAGWIVKLLFGPEFSASVEILRILAWTLIPFVVNSYLTLSFLASNKEKFLGYILTLSTILLLALNLWWIPSAGARGSAWAALLAESAQTVFLFASILFLLPKGERNELSQLS